MGHGERASYPVPVFCDSKCSIVFNPSQSATDHHIIALVCHQYLH